ncbi:carbohydrate sulfotransferase 11-like isoform X2 [Octopus vulgaris]|uniref:Carbohydrate sulfotransferase n=1 Tax=Octopus vulgaris TaxID=6645 RepID=A0AA36F0S5_OCTVU|nr:carbohydrate sulfotransferase 11-like isoform X2 [Octopus vulgaris]
MQITKENFWLATELHDSRDLHHLQNERKKALQETCKNTSLALNYVNAMKSMQISHKDQILYCGIAKVGCTFFKRLMYVLNSEKLHKSLFDITPNNIHGMHTALVSDLKEPNKSLVEINYKTFLFVRNPYKRLFSGYVDKIFTPQMYFLLKYGTYIIKKFRKNPSEKSLRCGHDVTFAEFISYVIDSVKTGNMANNHFTPMYLHCAPCEIHYDLIGHLETLQNDLQFLIKPERLKAVLPENLRMSSLRDELFDATDIAFRNLKSNQNCFSPYELLERIWHRLQIRGILNQKFSFPLTPEEAQTIKQDDFYKKLNTYLEKSQMDPSTVNNRHESINEAFSTVPLDILEKLQSVMEMDCKLFGYDTQPDFVFKAKNYVNKSFKYFNEINN